MCWIQARTLSGYRIPSQWKNYFDWGAASWNSQVAFAKICQTVKNVLVAGPPFQGVIHGGNMWCWEISTYFLSCCGVSRLPPTMIVWPKKLLKILLKSGLFHNYCLTLVISFPLTAYIFTKFTWDDIYTSFKVCHTCALRFIHKMRQRQRFAEDNSKSRYCSSVAWTQLASILSGVFAWGDPTGWHLHDDSKFTQSSCEALMLT